MAKSKYAKYVNPLRLWTELIRPSYRGKMADFSLLFDEQVYPDTPIWVETFHAYAPGTGVGVPGELPAVFNGKEHKRKVRGQHAHPDFDELFLFFGTNPYDNTRLGGVVEAWLGEGKDAQKFIIKEPTAKWVPKDLAHNPWIVTKVDDPRYPIIIMVIALSPRYSVQSSSRRDLPHPPAFSMDKLGVEQPGQGKYSRCVKKMPLSRDLIFPWHRGRVAVPTLMFDKHVIPDIPVPLRTGEPEPILALNQILHELYDRAGYDLALDYSQPPVPPLADDDADWAASLLAQHLSAFPSGPQQ